MSNSFLCDFGCGRAAIKQFKNQRWCCSNHANSCPERKKELSLTRRSYDNAARYNQWSETYNKVDSEGLTSAVRNGQNKAILIPKGSPRAKEIGAKVKASRLANNPTSYLEAARKAVTTKASTYLCDGRSVLEANLEKASRPHRKRIPTLDGEIYVDSSLEEDFVRSKTQQGLVVKRGPTIWYVDADGVRKPYLVDFQIGDELFEIKSKSSFDMWRGIPQRAKNILKLNAAADQGYTINLVLDGHISRWEVQH